MYKRLLRFDKLLVRLPSRAKSTVWLENRVVRSPFKDVEIPDATLPEYIWRNLDRWPNRTAVVCL